MTSAYLPGRNSINPVLGTKLVPGSIVIIRLIKKGVPKGTQHKGVVQDGRRNS